MAPFRLLDLPQELRDRIYFFTVASARSYHKLTGQPSDWFDPAILRVNHQVHDEASEAISKTEINIPINHNTINTYYLGEDRSTLSERLAFERCSVHLHLPLPDVGRYDVVVHIFFERRAQDLIKGLVRNLGRMPQLKQLRIKCVYPIYLLNKEKLNVSHGSAGSKRPRSLDSAITPISRGSPHG